MTDSMSGSKGLLGYPDMVCLGMLPQHFPLVITHSYSATADIEGGHFPIMCEEMEGDGQIREVRVGKVLGVDGRMENKEEAGKVKEKTTDLKKQEGLDIEPVTMLAGPTRGPGMNNTGLLPGGTNQIDCLLNQAEDNIDLKVCEEEL